LTPRLLNLTSGVPVVLESTLPVSGNFAAVLEAAITKRHRVSVRYQGMKDIAARDRIFEPIDLRLSQRAWYVFGIDVDSKQPRTFKLSRLQAVDLLDERCSLIEHVDADHEHEHAVNVWNSADVHDVAVRIFPPQARVAHEYPLTSTQLIEPDGDAVIVHAKVSGLEEVTRWVLRWGGDAQVLAPQALQDRLRGELARMTAHLSAHP
jgi:predicted DNA-binding transcriptional regulator YafY